MPRNVRSFWIEGSAEGVDTPIKAGPRRKDGRLDLTIYMRHRGCVAKVAHLSGRANNAHTLQLTFEAFPHKDGMTVCTDPEDRTIVYITTKIDEPREKTS